MTRSSLSQGFLAGTVTINGTAHYADALLIETGELRLYVGGPVADVGGALQVTRPESAAQFIAKISSPVAGIAEERFSTVGEILTRGCHAARNRPSCDAVTRATLTGDAVLRPVTRELHIGGALRVGGDNATETWAVDLDAWEVSLGPPPAVGDLTGQFEEVIAEFSGDGDTFVTVDGNGRLFFQSPRSGCIGNGTRISTKLARLPGKPGAFGSRRRCALDEAKPKT